MKKEVALFIAVLYLTVSSGLAVEIHHCMGSIADFSLTTHSEEKSTCGQCGMPKDSNNCCKDELRFVKIQDAYKLLNVNYQLEVPQITLHDHQYLFNDRSISQVSLVNTAGNSPPGGSNNSLCIRNCVFRI